MASFPDLWPHARLASAERRAARCFRLLVGLLTAFAVLRDFAFVAVSELATLRGKKALKAPVFPARSLCSCAAILVGNPATEAGPA